MLARRRDAAALMPQPDLDPVLAVGGDRRRRSMRPFQRNEWRPAVELAVTRERPHLVAVRVHDRHRHLVALA